MPSPTCCRPSSAPSAPPRDVCASILTLVSYPDLQRDILEEFVESQQLPSAMSHWKRCSVGIAAPARVIPIRPVREPKPLRVVPPPRVPLPPVPPRIVQAIGRAHIYSYCLKCGQGLTSNDPRVVKMHVLNCGRRSGVR